VQHTECASLFGGHEAGLWSSESYRQVTPRPWQAASWNKPTSPAWQTCILYLAEICYL